MSRQSASVGSWIAAIVVVVALVAGGIYLARKALHPGSSRSTVATTAAPSTSASTASAAPIQHPISQASAPASAATAPLPALDDSDSSVTAALEKLAGGTDLAHLLVTPQLISRMVATIDALPRQALGTRMLPLRTPRDAFLTTEADGKTVISPKNFERYASYMRLIQRIDPQALVAWYVHEYPLFQRAYRQLGYPKGYFNDRLIVVIDNLLAAPQASDAQALVRPSVLYQYADPSLEALSAGQKLMMRTGPANERVLKSRLRAIRAALTGVRLPAGATSTPVPAAPATAG